MFITAHLFVKGVSLVIGIGLFAQPVTDPVKAWLDEKVPDWRSLLKIRYTVLRGIPTNAQLTLTLLRIGEANRSPLPPPAHAEAPTATTRAATDVGDSEKASPSIAFPPNHGKVSKGSDNSTPARDAAPNNKQSEGKRTARLLNFIGLVAKSTVRTALRADKFAASAGSRAAKNRLGRSGQDGTSDASGPNDFRARCNGDKGHVYISAGTAVPYVAFTTAGCIEAVGSQAAAATTDLAPVWKVPVAGIRELKKVGGYGWKTKLLVGWAMDGDVADGLEITGADGAVWRATAMPLRDELFNRLVACGGRGGSIGEVL